MSENLQQLQNKIEKCKKCPRLVRYLKQIKQKYPTYWCKPVPSFGDSKAKILIIGLAPGRFGSNRTARMFTGDSSGNFMYKILHDVGLSTKPIATDISDGLTLKSCYITAMGRCAPPQNKPTPKELGNCFPYFIEEVELLKNIKVVVCLGRIAFDGYLKWLIRHSYNARSLLRCLPGNDILRKKDFKFSHGAVYNAHYLPHVLIASYHPSRQNTQTGKLTSKMFRQIFEKAIQYSS